MNRLQGACVMALNLIWSSSVAQVIPFESNGLHYQALTRSNVTVMCAPMTLQLHGYTIIQAAVSNGSPGPYMIRPEDFIFVRADGEEVRAAPARMVINMLAQMGSGTDVIKLTQAYEAAVYGNQHVKSTNGYEQRRQAA